MLERLPIRRHVRRLATLSLAVLAMAAVPGRNTLPVAAQQTVVDENLVDLQGQFAQGTLQRTAVSAGVVPAVNGNPPFGDNDGVLQLTPIGGLDATQWAPTIGLPQARAQMGVTTIGERLFVIGGATGSQGGAVGFANSAYWAKLDPQSGGVVPHGLTTPPPNADIATNDFWVNDPMPAVSAYKEDDPYPECNDETIQQRVAPAVASFTAGNGKSYIYVIGGGFTLTNCGTGNFSSSAVQIGEYISATNDIDWSTTLNERENYVPSQDLPNFESWSTTPVLNPALPSFGVEQATASVVTTSSGTTYLYVIGGQVNYVNIDAATMATPAVFYTRLNATTGALENPVGLTDSVWARTANVPMNLVLDNPLSAPNPGNLGIFSHVAIVSKAVVGEGTGTTVTPVIYVTGGYTTNELGVKTANATVFRARIGNQGALSWDTDLYTPSPADETVTTEGKGRAGAGGFAFANKLYVLGGIADSDTTNTDPYGTGTVAVHNDKLDLLPLFGDTSSRVFFIGTDEQPDVFPPVQGIGAAVIPAAPLENATTVDSAAFGYVIGGFDSANAAVTTVYRGKLGGSSETSATRRVPDGWYYSKFYDIRLDKGTADETDARIVGITWYAGVDRTNPNADMKVEFRRTRALPCNEAAFTGAGTEWKTLDGDGESAFYSKTGDAANEVKLADVPGLADPIASCLQFRVYMTQNGSTAEGVPNAAVNNTLSPKLYRLSVQKIKPGDPDLFVESFTIGTTARGQISSFDLKIKNLNGSLLNTSAVAGGQFPVVLCMQRIDLDDARGPNFSFTPPTLPIVNDPDSRVNCAPLYRWIDPSETLPGQIFTLNANWRVNFNGYFPGKAQDSAMNPITAAFTTPGHYAVTAMIDPFGLVPEAGSGKANNRGENLNNGQPLVRRFTIEDGVIVYLPVIGR